MTVFIRAALSFFMVIILLRVMYEIYEFIGENSITSGLFVCGLLILFGLVVKIMDGGNNESNI